MRIGASGAEVESVAGIDHESAPGEVVAEPGAVQPGKIEDMRSSTVRLQFSGDRIPQRVLRAQILKIAVDSSLSERAQDLAIFGRKLFWPAQNKNERIDGGDGRAYTNTKRPTIRVEMWRKA